MLSESSITQTPEPHKCSAIMYKEDAHGGDTIRVGPEVLGQKYQFLRNCPQSLAQSRNQKAAAGAAQCPSCPLSSQSPPQAPHLARYQYVLSG